jgi:phosphoribosylformimino-5-aminoimidazole carboxamide ribotide isomerase
VPEEVRSDSCLSSSPFDIIPAIDLLSGACVRLLKGRYDSFTRYAVDPVEVACRFEAAGARWLHVVDLEAAKWKAGEPGADGPPAHNRAVIRRIRRSVSCRLEVGGGVRSETDVLELLDAGVDRLVLGTVLARDPDTVATWRERFGALFVAGIDADRGRVKVAGWEADGGADDLTLARRSRALGMLGIVYTTIDRDGTMEGPALEQSNRIAEASGLPVVVSGGVGRPSDVERVVRLRHPRVCGLLIGKAIYEGRVDLDELIRRFQSPET